MKTVLSTVDFPSLDFPTLASLAGGCQFDSVELTVRQADSAFSEPSKIREIFSSQNVQISAVRISPDDKLIGTQLKQNLILAGDLGATVIRLPGDLFFRRTGIASQVIVDALLAAGDFAADRGLSILLENQGTVGSALRLWRLLDRLNHPSVACCWDTELAIAAGDMPAVAIPLLNTRIRTVQMRAASIDSQFVRQTLNRLRGVGFDDQLILAVHGTDPEQHNLQLTNARATLARWKILPAMVAV